MPCSGCGEDSRDSLLRRLGLLPVLRSQSLHVFCHEALNITNHGNDVFLGELILFSVRCTISHICERGDLLLNQSVVFAGFHKIVVHSVHLAQGNVALLAQVSDGCFEHDASNNSCRHMVARIEKFACLFEFVSEYFCLHQTSDGRKVSTLEVFFDG